MIGCACSYNHTQRSLTYWSAATNQVTNGLIASIPFENDCHRLSRKGPIPETVSPNPANCSSNQAHIGAVTSAILLNAFWTYCHINSSVGVIDFTHSTIRAARLPRIVPMYSYAGANATANVRPTPINPCPNSPHALLLRATVSA